ncbi:MAG: DUF47 family protein [Deltaproteobacteria bacterium]|nr:DUF47 family protein [Deltaproteobacteria bacterium]
MKKWFQRKNIFIKFLIIGWSSILLIVLPSFLIMSYFLNKTERAARIHTMTDSIIIQMLNARIAEKNFILRDLQNEKFYNASISNNLQAHQRFTVNVQEQIGHLIKWRPVNEKNSADRLIQLVKEYSNIFTELVATYQKIGFRDWGLLGQWRRAIHEAEAQITGMNRMDMQESLLQLRRLEKDYLLRGDETYLQDMRDRITESRGDVLELLENMDALLDCFKGAMWRFEIEYPTIPAEMHNDFKELVACVVDAVEAMVRSARTFFKDIAAVADQAEDVADKLSIYVIKRSL